ncbi:MAG: hypothetical protein HUJ27_00870 [Rhodobacteraceae bacterium]|nr:hypothetical protein [Paracoccaceae bacterium]
MTTSAQRRQGPGRLSRRRLFAASGIVIIAVAAGRVAALKIRDNPMAQRKRPSLVYEDGWILDARDREGPDNQ